MAEKKKYHWLKLPDNFFKRHDIKIIKQMDNGEKYVIFYQQLLLESISHEGELRFSELIPYDEKMLAVITDTDIDIVRNAMKLLVDLGMVQILDDATIFMTDCEKMIGKDESSAERVRKHREKLRLEEENDVTKCNVTVTLPSNSNSNSISNSISNIKEGKNIIPPTIEMVQEYCQERNNQVDPNTFYDFYETKGWKVGTNKMKDWQACIRTWEKREKKAEKGGNSFEGILSEFYED